jgi:hypothetical protein
MVWTRQLHTGAIPLPRNCHSLTAVGDQLFLFGGFGTYRGNELQQLDSSTFRVVCLRADRLARVEGAQGRGEECFFVVRSIATVVWTCMLQTP